MGRRTLLAALLLSAPLLDAAGTHRFAFWALVAAVPVASACALEAFGGHLDGGGGIRSLQALLWVPATVLLLASAVARGPAVATDQVPRLGVTALVGCLVVLALKAALDAGARLWRLRVRGSGLRPAHYF